MCTRPLILPHFLDGQDSGPSFHSTGMHIPCSTQPRAQLLEKPKAWALKSQWKPHPLFLLLPTPGAGGLLNDGVCVYLGDPSIPLQALLPPPPSKAKVMTIWKPDGVFLWEGSHLNVFQPFLL